MTEGAVAVIAAHPDDEVLGCGGTMARWAAQGRAVHVLLLADGESARTLSAPAHAAPAHGAPAQAAHPHAAPTQAARLYARKSAATRACELLGCREVQALDLPDNRLDSLALLDVVQRIEAFISQVSPTTVLTHHGGDVNIDHRITHDAVVTACRPLPSSRISELMFFEIPSSTEWQPPGSATPFLPNVFVDIAAQLALKLQALGVYESELRAFPHPRSLDAVTALARWRGATAGVPAAEAFIMGRQIVR